LPKAKAASDPVVGRIVDSGREIHSRIVQQLLKMGVRAEQQAFAKFDLNFVIDRYLPEKLKQPGKFLP
jgi:DNA topoisomerase VI subunit A